VIAQIKIAVTQAVAIQDAAMQVVVTPVAVTMAAVIRAVAAMAAVIPVAAERAQSAVSIII